MVLKACGGSAQALEDLASCYWPAVYAFLRRKGFSPEDAEDIAQETFSRLLRGDRLAPVDPKNGQFRSFLCASAAHEASHFRESRAADKRGGNQVESLDQLGVDAAYKLDLSDKLSAEQVFDRTWSKIIVSRALDGLGADYRRLGKTEIFQALLPLLNSGPERGGHDLLAGKLGMTPVNVRVTWTRFKASFVQRLRQEVADTVADPAEVEPELRHLLKSWLAAEG